jgi:hypothetical protein
MKAMELPSDYELHIYKNLTPNLAVEAEPFGFRYVVDRSVALYNL